MILNFNFHYWMKIEWTKGTRTHTDLQDDIYLWFIRKLESLAKLLDIVKLQNLLVTTVTEKQSKRLYGPRFLFKHVSTLTGWKENSVNLTSSWFTLRL